MDRDFECALAEHLRKEELLFRAKNKPHCSNCEWLTGFCSSTDSIAKLLRSLGFRVKEIVDEVSSWGNEFRWVETTSGVVVYVNTELSRGFVAGRSKRE